MKLNKIILGAFALIFAVVMSTNATTVKTNSDEIVVKVDPQKTEISASELPSAVKQAIAKGDFAKWSIAKAYKITYEESEMPENDPEKSEGEARRVEYEVHYVNAQNEKEIEVYDATGKVVEEE